MNFYCLKFVIIFLFISQISFGQKKYFEKKFIHYQIIKKKDTIHFHMYGKENLSTKKGFIVFIQGSGATSLYQTIRKTDTIIDAKTGKKKLKKYVEVHSSAPFQLQSFPKEYPLVLISKTTIPFEISSDNYKISKDFYKNDGINFRAKRISEVINYITKKIVKNPKKVIVIGHSEGSDVVAKLGTINKKITHIGFWSGGGNTQYYDFALMIRKKVIAGEITEQEGVHELEQLFVEIKDIYKHPKSIEKQWLGHPYRKWVHATEPAIDNLLKIDIPIFVAAGTKDKAVPIESSLLIPVEFIKHQKTNLTYKMYSNLDHSFLVVDKKKQMYEWESKWNTVFSDFLDWVEKN